MENAPPNCGGADGSSIERPPKRFKSKAAEQKWHYKQRKQKERAAKKARNISASLSTASAVAATSTAANSLDPTTVLPAANTTSPSVSDDSSPTPTVTSPLDVTAVLLTATATSPPSASSPNKSRADGSSCCRCCNNSSLATFSEALTALSSKSGHVSGHKVTASSPIPRSADSDSAVEASTNLSASPLSPIKRRRILDESYDDAPSPETKELLRKIEKKINESSSTKRQKLYSATKDIFVRNQPAAQRPMTSSSGPVLNPDAFNYYAPNTRGVPKEFWSKPRTDYGCKNRLQRFSHGDMTPNPKLKSQCAEQKAVRRIVEAVEAAGDEDQRAWALFKALNHSKLRKYVGNIYRTFKTDAVQVGLHAVKGMEKLVQLISRGKEHGGLTKQCRAFLQMIAMCFADDSGNSDSVSQRAIFRTVFKSLSRWSTRELMAKAGEKRKRMEEEDIRAFMAVEVDERRSKYQEVDIEKLREWMCRCRYARASPNAKDTLDKRDMYGRKIRTGTFDSKGKPVFEKVHKILISACPRELHLLMCSDPKDGGYEEARDALDKVRFSLATLRTYYPNWLKQMDESDMNMCACETCQTMDDLHNALVAKRRKIIERTEAELEEMTGTTRSVKQAKATLEKKLNEYKALVEIPVPNEKPRPIHKDGWEACDQYGCGERVRIAGHEHEFIPYRCQKGDCPDCDKAGYEPPEFESTLVDKREIIKYSKFQRTVCCSVPGHGGHYIKTFSTQPKLRCMWCEENEKRESGWKRKHKATVGQRKSRKIFHAPLQKYTGPKGDYTQALKKMRSHKQSVILAGTKMKTEPRTQYVKSEKGKVVSMVRDFMEKMCIAANNQMQFEYFNKEVSLGAEGITVYLQKPGAEKFETVFYMILSTDKKQDGRIVYHNTEMVLSKIKSDMERERENGNKVLMIEAILDNSDGCSVQYRCGTALFMLWKFANETGISYEKTIDAGSHGKGKVDGENGIRKNKLKKGLCGNVTSQPECFIEGKNSIVYVDMDKDGNVVDFADVAAKYLNNDVLAGKVPANRPRVHEEDSDRKTARSYHLVRKANDAKFDGIKMVAELKKHELGERSKNNGIGSMKHFRFERALAEWFVCCHVTCYCSWCVSQLKKSTPQERYGVPRRGCVLWPMMEIKDAEGNPTGKGYNDWVYGRFVQRKDSDHQQYHAALRDMNIKTGKRYATEIVEGNYGAYMVDDEESPFYIVEWEGEPWRAEDDGSEVLDNQTYSWKKGDYLCYGRWLDKLHGGRNWYTMDSAQRRCIVMLEQVVNANLDMRPYTDKSGYNPLPPLSGRSKERAKTDGAWRLSDSDYIWLIEESRLRENIFEYDEEEANRVLHQERIDEQWKSMPVGEVDSDVEFN